MNYSRLASIEKELSRPLSSLSLLQQEVRERLTCFADGKNLKGDEIVGWLGEIYTKELFGGRLVNDRQEHDIETDDGLRISVKTRKGWKSGWKQSSAIPAFENSAGPTDLVFVHLNEDYSIDRIWRYEWRSLRSQDRFRPHYVRGNLRSYVFSVDEERDSRFLVYEREPASNGGQPSASGLGKTPTAHLRRDDDDAVVAAEVNKVQRRLQRWAKHKHQVNAKILRLFLRLRGRRDSAVTASMLEDAYGDSSEFSRNFPQMKNFGPKNHGKVFNEEDGLVEIWKPVENAVKQFEREVLEFAGD